MGNCLGKPQTTEPQKNAGSNKSGSTQNSAGAKKPAAKTKDFGLGERYEPIRFLGAAHA